MQYIRGKEIGLGIDVNWYARQSQWILIGVRQLQPEMNRWAQCAAPEKETLKKCKLENRNWQCNLKECTRRKTRKGHICLVMLVVYHQHLQFVFCLSFLFKLFELIFFVYLSFLQFYRILIIMRAVVTNFHFGKWYFISKNSSNSNQHMAWYYEN